MTNDYAKLISILFLWVLVSACTLLPNVGDKNEEVDNTPTLSKNTVEIYILEELQPEVRVVKIEPVPQYNCNGNAEVENKVKKI